MCQTQERLLSLYSCVQYTTTKKGRSTRGKALLIGGAGLLGVGVALVGIGVLAPVVPFAIPAVLVSGASAVGLTGGAAGGALALGSAVAGVGGTGTGAALSVTRSGGSMDDYEKAGEYARRDDYEPASEWINSGPTYEVIVAAAHPCL